MCAPNGSNRPSKNASGSCTVSDIMNSQIANLRLGCTSTTEPKVRDLRRRRIGSLITVAEMIRDRNPIERLLLGVAAGLVLVSACTASNEVLEDDTPTASTIAEAESATTTLEPASSNTTSPTSTTRSTTAPTVAPTRLPGVETIGNVEQLPGNMVIGLDPSAITVLVAPLTTLIDRDRGRSPAHSAELVTQR